MGRDTDKDNVVVLGDKVGLVKDAGREYRTMIEDMYGGGSYLVGIPSYRGIPMTLRLNDEVLMLFYRESGRYICPTRVASLDQTGEIQYALLLQKSEPFRDQRRGAFRLPVRMKVQIFKHPEEQEETGVAGSRTAESGQIAEAAQTAQSAQTEETGMAVKPAQPEPVALETAGSRDISVTGVSLVTNKEYKPRQKYLLKLHTGVALGTLLGNQREDRQGEETPYQVSAWVVRSATGYGRDRYSTSFHFQDRADAPNDPLAKYIFEEQQKQLKRRNS